MKKYIVRDKESQYHSKVGYERDKDGDYVYWTWPTGLKMALKFDVNSNCTFIDVDGNKHKLPSGILYDLVGCANILKKANPKLFCKDIICEVGESDD